MRYFKEIENGYITTIGEGLDGVEITKEEYDNIMNVIENRPIAPEHYTYLLKEDLTWVLAELQEEPTDEEVLI